MTRLARTAFQLGLLVAFVFVSRAEAEKLQEKTKEAWKNYERFTEERIKAELKNTAHFLRLDTMKDSEAKIARSKIKSGEPYIEKMPATRDGKGQDIKVDNGLIHHWYGVILIQNTKVEPLLHWIQDYDQTSKYFKPEVTQSQLLPREAGDNADTFRLFLRLTRTKIITVNYKTWHMAVYQRDGEGLASSSSHTTKIAELKDAGTPGEKELPVENDSGYFWRLNSYWRFKQEGNDVVVECESISLSRGIPTMVSLLNMFTLGTIRGVIESLPRESLQNTLISMRAGAPRTK